MTESLPAPLSAQITRAQKTQVLNLVRRAARAEIMPRFRNLGAADIDRKSGPQDLVTDADREAEKMIARGLQALWPDAVIVGEEDASARPEVVDGLPEAALGFTIDPVDGTWNFANGLPLFGVMVAMTRYGVPVFGLLYDPVMDDCIWAETGEAAELVKGRQRPRPLRASSGGTLEDLVGFASPYLLPRDRQDSFVATLPRLSRAVSMRCACHEFRTFAQGGADFVLATKVTPWDHTPGALIAERAGGYVRMLDGSDYRAGTTSGYLLAASDKTTWQRLRDLWAFLL
ncbi:inositol monophosphatase family protein [Roseivivax sediminis]|uniref:Fructose-1,6-bisphosphatase n=1 Tax=Roseivivax sediminis TaxID=936889 RepID=A0A1I2BJU0_9RHOB|nr:inositol monophosphatase [Roseivivax sediminis]SFE56068.1 fructose-1,6-bisphosphatase [Roseivivax sediminis]